MEKITTEIQASLEELIKQVKEPEQVEAIGKIKGLCDSADKAYNDLFDKHDNLKTKYAEQVKNGVFKTPNNDEPHKEEHQEVSLEDTALEFLEKQE